MKNKFRFLCFYFILLPGIILSQKIENVEVIQEGNLIIITYDLINDDVSKKFDISLELSQNGGNTYTINPKSLTGDVKSNILPGKKKKVSWDVLKDIAGLQGDNFVFKIIASDEKESVKIKSGGIPTWIWIGGGAVIVGGATAILLGGKKSNGTTEKPDLPIEPSWPK